MKDELVEILDEQGNKTGQVLLKSEAHAKSLWHPVVHLWVFNSKGEILSQKRSHHKLVWPNLWDIAVGGHVAAGDNMEDAVIRETAEELGLKVDIKGLMFVGRFQYEHQMDGWLNRIFIWAYILKKDLNISELSLEKEEVSEVKWMGIDEFEALLKDPKEAERFSPDIQSYCQMVFTKIRKQLNSSN